MKILRRKTRLCGAASMALLFLSACGPGANMSPVVLLDTPSAPGSMASNIATGANGEIVLSWVEPAGEGHSLRYAKLDEGHWSAASTVASGDNWFVNWADFPSVVPLADSVWGASWLVSQPAGGYAYDVHASVSGDSGATWSAPFIPHTDNTPTEHGFVSLFADSGGVGMLWLDGRKMVNEYDDNDVGASGMTLRTATFGTDTLPIREALVDDLVCDCCQTDIAMAATGPLAIYRDRTTDEVRDIYVSRREFGEWQPGIPVSTDHWEIAACPVNGPVIRAQDSRVAAAWFTAANDRPVVKAAFSTDAAKSFSAPVDVSVQAALGHIGAVMLTDGDLVVAWHGSLPGGKAELLLRKVTRNGELSNVYRLEQAADVFAFSVPQIAWSGSDLVVAWTTSKDNVYAVSTARVSLEVFTVN